MEFWSLSPANSGLSQALPALRALWFLSSGTFSLCVLEAVPLPAPLGVASYTGTSSLCSRAPYLSTQKPLLGPRAAYLINCPSAAYPINYPQVDLGWLILLRAVKGRLGVCPPEVQLLCHCHLYIFESLPQIYLSYVLIVQNSTALLLAAVPWGHPFHAPD